jgi:predicted O-methyltransferase YrrM
VISSDAVVRYLRAGVGARDELLAEMERHGDRDGIPIVVPETGAALHVLARACAARRLVEVGTAIGVSTLYLARALPEDGVVVSFEIDEARHRAAVGYLERAGVAARTDLRLQDAAVGLAALERGSFDMVFLDGLKQDYPTHLELALPLLRRGGVLAVDNTLLSGAVAEGRATGHWSQEAVERMRAFNQRVLEDAGLAAALLPVGDGLLVAVTL